MQKQIDALAVANWFLKKAASSPGKTITNLKLQKLLYYAQAWHLVFLGKRLFPEPIEAWVHGPAIRHLYGKFKEYGFNPIQYKGDADTSLFSNKQTMLLNDVWKIYGKFDGAFLEALTHSELPWQKAREGLDAGDFSRREISTELMKKYYASKLEDTGAE